MITLKGYSIEEYPKQNKIVITLPQIMKTCTSTSNFIGDRKEQLTEAELVWILCNTTYLYENKERKNND